VLDRNARDSATCGPPGSEGPFYSIWQLRRPTVKRPIDGAVQGQELPVVGACGVARRSSRRDRARPLASLHVLSALPADCLHNPVPFALWSPIHRSSLRALACYRVNFVPIFRVCVLTRSVCPHIPGAMIDLGRYSPSWGRIASKISLGRRGNRIKRTFAGRQPSAPPSFGHFGPGGWGLRQGIAISRRVNPAKVSLVHGATPRSLDCRLTFRVRAPGMPDIGGLGLRRPVQDLRLANRPRSADPLDLLSLRTTPHAAAERSFSREPMPRLAGWTRDYGA